MEGKYDYLKMNHIILSFFLLTLGSIYSFFKLFGYAFVPVSCLILSIVAGTIIVGLTANGEVNKNERTKVSNIFSALLPLLAIFFIVSRGIASDTSGVNSVIYSVQSYVILLCVMILFFSGGCGKFVKIWLGIIYSILMITMSIWLFFIIILWDFGKNTVVKSEMSPNGIYLAEIIKSDSGALGGSTLVNVTRQNRNINILIGELKKAPKRVYLGRYGEFNTMVLRWETDEILYINEKKYSIP